MQLVIGDLDLFCAGPNWPSWREQLTKAIDGGRARPQWCFSLRAGDERLAAVSYWAPFDGADPVLAWHFDPGADPWFGAEVLRRSVGTLGVRRILHDVRLPAGARPDTTEDIRLVHQALTAGGFPLEVERLELAWRPQAGLSRDPGRLRYRPARELGEDAMLDVLHRVAVGSLDHDTRTELAAGRGEQDAREAYQFVTTCGGEPDWFEFGYLGDELVGFVVPARQPTWAQIAYIGVVPEHRGHGYVDDLLARGTATLAAAGAEEVTAGTDTGNRPMAAAFARAGYADAGRVFRYSWRAELTTGPLEHRGDRPHERFRTR